MLSKEEKETQESNIRGKSEKYGNSLILAGFMVLCLGVASNYIARVAKNTQACLDARIHGLTFGTVLIVSGALWRRTVLERSEHIMGCSCAIIGSFASWLGVQCYALADVSKDNKILSSLISGSAFHRGSLSAEVARLILIATTMQVLIIIPISLLAWGLNRNKGTKRSVPYAGNKVTLGVGLTVSFLFSVFFSAGTEVLPVLGILLGCFFGFTISALLYSQPAASFIAFAFLMLATLTWAITFSFTVKIMP